MDTEAMCLRCEPGTEFFVVTKLTAPAVARHHIKIEDGRAAPLLPVSQPSGEKIYYGLVERAMKGGAIEAGRVLTNLRSGRGKGVAAGRQKHEMIGALDEVGIRMHFEIVADHRAIPGVRSLAIVFHVP